MSDFVDTLLSICLHFFSCTFKVFINIDLKQISYFLYLPTRLNCYALT